MSEDAKDQPPATDRRPAELVTETTTRYWIPCSTKGCPTRIELTHAIRRAQRREELLDDSRYHNNCHRCGLHLQYSLTPNEAGAIQVGAEWVPQDPSTRSVTGLALLKSADSEEGAIYMVVRDDYIDYEGNLADATSHRYFYYDENTYVLNWLDRVVAVIQKGDTDPTPWQVVQMYRPDDIMQRTGLTVDEILNGKRDDYDVYRRLFPEAFPGHPDPDTEN